MRLGINDMAGDVMRSCITVSHKGSFDRTQNYFKKLSENKFYKKLHKFGIMGVNALESATPVRTGRTAASWKYEIVISNSTVTLQWINTNTTGDGRNVVQLLVRGHGTRNGHYVKGRDFVTPALQPVFDEISKSLVEEVTD